MARIDPYLATLGRIVPLVALALAVASNDAVAQVPAEYQGDWVSAKATCDAPLRFQVEAVKVTLVNGKDSQSFGDVEMAGPGYWGPDYTGILAVLIPEFNGDQPFTAMFNVGEKKGVAQVEFAPILANPGTNAASVTLNNRYKKLNLAQRFPFNAVLLKKCPVKGS